MSARHSKKHVNKMKAMQSGIVKTPTRTVFIAGVLATSSIVPLIGINNMAYADTTSVNSNHRSNTASAARFATSANAHGSTANNDDYSNVTIHADGTVSSVRSFTPANQRAVRVDYLSEANTQAASRGSSRDAGEITGDWGGIEQLSIPVTKSTAQNDATAVLTNAINDANNVYNNSDGKVDSDDNRNALKQLIDESGRMTDDVSISADDLKAQADKLNVQKTKVNDDIDARNARIQAEQAARRRSSSSNRGSSYANSENVQANYDEWVKNHADRSMGSKVLAYAEQFNNYPYVWAAAGPNAFDCSGLVMYVYAHFGIALPHYSGSQMNAGRPVANINEATYGDIIASSGHAALFAGFDGDGDAVVFNALNPSAGVTYTKLKYAFPNGYVIRRIF